MNQVIIQMFKHDYSIIQSQTLIVEVTESLKAKVAMSIMFNIFILTYIAVV